MKPWSFPYDGYTIVITYLNEVPPCRNAPSDLDESGYTEIDFEVIDSSGQRDYEFEQIIDDNILKIMRQEGVYSQPWREQ